MEPKPSAVCSSDSSSSWAASSSLSCASGGADSHSGRTAGTSRGSASSKSMKIPEIKHDETLDEWTTAILETGVDMGDMEEEDPAAPSSKSPSKGKFKGKDKVKKRVAPSMQKKAIKARFKALVDKFGEIEKRVDHAVPKDEGVLVEGFQVGNGPQGLLNKEHDYTQLLKLKSTGPFMIVKETMLQEGPYAGHVALIIKQCKPFRLLDLPTGIRAKVLGYVVNHDEDSIPMKFKQGGTKDPYSPAYTAPNKLAILATCKLIHTEAVPMVYAHKFHFPGTQVLANFLTRIEHHRQYLRFISCDTYNGLTARNAFQSLPPAQNIERIFFSHVNSNQSPKTAIEHIFNDAQGWFRAMATDDDVLRGLSILQFDQSAYFYKEKGNGGVLRTVKWGDEQRAFFAKGLKEKVEKLAKKLGHKF
ncbi:hypothetical protein B0J11DRAFT_615223 [Dendryphion nanum]|uniref:Uncharacterized protein n=1 Tax=Dendryphion nanum TaxID=256645 RepID=A0A9P9DQW9_9PLEO|nr:hypothetical protein B0J11DRAFT_615223 [Dendryphion nanum]